MFKKLRLAVFTSLLSWIMCAPLYAADDCLSADLCLGAWNGLNCSARADEPKQVYGLDDRVNIDVKGACFRKLSTLLATKTRDTLPVTLFLHGIEILDLPLTVTATGAEQATLSFQLRRNSLMDTNREAWTKLLGSQHSGVKRELDLAVAIGTGLAVSVQNPKNTIKFEVRDQASINWIVCISVSLFLFIYAWFIGSSILRDSKDGWYSMGRAQMALWFLLVIACLIAIFFTTGSLERLPPQVLILLGISSATGFAAKIVGNTKTTGLASEKDKLVADQAAAPTTFASGSGPARLIAVNKALAKPQSHSCRHFLQDICSDGDGVNIYRVQVVFWTLTLGAVFVWTVAQVVAMPEFPTELLTLLGVSNGTYVALKMPEN